MVATFGYLERKVTNQNYIHEGFQIDKIQEIYAIIQFRKLHLPVSH
jgi:hypothetical protein